MYISSVFILSESLFECMLLTVFVQDSDWILSLLVSKVYMLWFCDFSGEVLNPKDRCKKCQGKKVIKESKILEVKYKYCCYKHCKVKQTKICKP